MMVNNSKCYLLITGENDVALNARWIKIITMNGKSSFE